MKPTERKPCVGDYLSKFICYIGSKPCVNRYVNKAISNNTSDDTKRLITITAEYIGDDASVIPKGAYQWCYSDLIQFSKLELYGSSAHSASK